MRTRSWFLLLPTRRGSVSISSGVIRHLSRKEGRKTDVRVLVALAIVFLLGQGCFGGQGTPSGTVSINGTEWYRSYDQARETAEKSGKKLLALVTAPDWCSPCQQLEAVTLQDTEVTRLLTDAFVLLHVEDRIDGKRNPLLDRFTFVGFPTLFLYNQQEELLTKAAGFIAADALYEWLEPYAQGPDHAEAFYLAFIGERGSAGENQRVYRQVSPESWKLIVGSKTTYLREIQRSDGFIYLYSVEGGFYLRVPQEGGTVEKTFEPEESWEAFDLVSLSES